MTERSRQARSRQAGFLLESHSTPIVVQVSSVKFAKRPPRSFVSQRGSPGLAGPYFGHAACANGFASLSAFNGTSERQNPLNRRRERGSSGIRLLLAYWCSSVSDRTISLPPSHSGRNFASEWSRKCSDWGCFTPHNLLQTTARILCQTRPSF